MAQSSLCDPWGYRVVARAGRLNKVSYANKECESFRKSIQACGFFWGPLWLFLFLKSSRADSNIAGKTITKQRGDLFLIVTRWQLGDLEAISAWLAEKKNWLSLNNTVIRDFLLNFYKILLAFILKKGSQEIVFCCGLKCDSAWWSKCDYKYRYKSQWICCHWLCKRQR